MMNVLDPDPPHLSWTILLEVGWVHNTLFTGKVCNLMTHHTGYLCKLCNPHPKFPIWKGTLELHHIQVGQPTIWCLKGTYVFKTDYRCLWLQHSHIVPNQPAPRSHAQIFARRHKEPKSQEVVCWCGFPWAAFPETPGIDSLNNRAPQKCAHMLPISYIAIQYIARHGGF